MYHDGSTLYLKQCRNSLQKMHLKFMYFDNAFDGGDVSKIDRERESLKVRQLLFSCLIILYCIHCYKLIFAVPIVPFIKLSCGSLLCSRIVVPL